MSTSLFDFLIQAIYIWIEEEKMRELKVEVVGIKERCGAKHKISDTFYIRGEGTIEIPEGKKFCLYALNSLFPFLTAKQREDELPDDDWIAETETLCCPDPKGVIFRVSSLVP